MNFSYYKTVASPVNTIYVVEALKDSELKTGIYKYDEIRDLIISEFPEKSAHINNTIFLRKAPDLESLLSIFEEIKGKCNSQMMPLIFIDGHGDKAKGLQLPSGEFISWELLNNQLQQITLAAVGNLTVVASFCHSMLALDNHSYLNLLPCPFYYGYNDEVSVEDILEEGKLIIKSFLLEGTLCIKPLKIRLYSEYDRANMVSTIMICKYLEPQKYADFCPELSKKKLKKMLGKDIGNKFGTKKKFNRFFAKNMILKNILPLLIESVMYATARRKKYIENVLTEVARLEAQKVHENNSVIG